MYYVMYAIHRKLYMLLHMLIHHCYNTYHIIVSLISMCNCVMLKLARFRVMARCGLGRDLCSLESRKMTRGQAYLGCTQSNE